MKRGPKRKAKEEEPSGEQDESACPSKRCPSPDIIHLEVDGEVSLYQTEEQVSARLEEVKHELLKYSNDARNHCLDLQRYEDYYNLYLKDIERYKKAIAYLSNLKTSTEAMIAYFEFKIPVARAAAENHRKRYRELEEKYEEKRWAVKKLSKLFKSTGDLLEFEGYLEGCPSVITDPEMENNLGKMNSTFKFIDLRKPEFTAKFPLDKFKEHPKIPSWIQNLIIKRKLCRISYREIRELSYKWERITARVKGIANAKAKEEAEVEKLKEKAIYRHTEFTRINMEFENFKADYTKALEVEAIERANELYMENRLRLFDVFMKEVNEQIDEINEYGSNKECSICIRNYNDKERVPMVGNCGHTFCLECAVQLARMSRYQQTTDSKPRIDCPTCKQLSTFVKNFSMIPTHSSRK